MEIPSVSEAAVLSEQSRGPRPPALVCRNCDCTIVEHFDNPLLALLKKWGRFAGEPTGGLAVCDPCMAKATAPPPVPPPPIMDCPAALKDATFANYAIDRNNTDAVTRVRSWLDAGRREGRDLFMFGPTGTGKTRLAITVARHTQLSARYARVPALLRKIRDGFNSHEGFEIQPLVDVPLLILDDIGAEKPTAFSMQTLETLYTERLDAGRRTIFTSNLPIADRAGYTRSLIDQLDDARFLSRLVGSADVVELTGLDRRLGDRRRQGL